MKKRAFVVLVLVAALLVVAVPALAQSEGRINGIVYADTNGNGVREDGEEGIRDVEVVFESAGWSLPVTTQPDGTFGIDLNPATWTVTVKPPTGYAALQSSQTVEIVNPGDTVSVEFAMIAVEEGEVLPDSGGFISEGALIGGLALLVVAGGAMVVIGQRRNSAA